MARKKSDKTFEEAAAEAGEARPLEDVLRKIVKPVKKKKGDGLKKEPSPHPTKS